MFRALDAGFQVRMRQRNMKHLRKDNGETWCDKNYLEDIEINIVTTIVNCNCPGCINNYHGRRSYENTR